MNCPATHKATGPTYLAGRTQSRVMCAGQEPGLIPMGSSSLSGCRDTHPDPIRIRRAADLRSSSFPLHERAPYPTAAGVNPPDGICRRLSNAGPTPVFKLNNLTHFLVRSAAISVRDKAEIKAERHVCASLGN
jgi:hypothetical protein